MTSLSLNAITALQRTIITELNLVLLN
jgi:hypothetical protein